MRAFVAVECKSNEIARLQEEMMSSSGWSAREVRPVSPDNFHFTLIFLGEISDSQAQQVKEELAGIKFEPFSITSLRTFRRSS